MGAGTYKCDAGTNGTVRFWDTDNYIVGERVSRPSHILSRDLLYYMNEIYKLLRIVGGRRKVPESELKRLLGIKEVDVRKVEWGNTMGIHLEVVELLAKKNLEKLLLLEKKKRGVGEDELVFVGMANVSSYYWCAAKSFLISKAEELKFFHAYLYDRILLQGVGVDRQNIQWGRGALGGRQHQFRGYRTPPPAKKSRKK
ncbi:MAG: hypothetical protein QXM43_00825 [Desulfurococcaceae archaeon]